MEVIKKPFIEEESPIMGIFAEKEFSQLDPNEKNYAYHYFKAAWEGSKICYFQKSFESPALFIILQYTFNQDISLLKSNALNVVSEKDWLRFTVYCASFLQNTGNYKSFGDSKFIPEISSENFFKIIQCSESYKISETRDLINKIWNQINQFIYSYNKPHSCLGINPEGLTGYYSADLTKDEILKIDEFLKVLNISPLNTRIGKLKDDEYVVSIASVNLRERQTHHFQEKKIHIIYGDFSPILRRVSYHLDKATNYSANRHQKQMCQNYVNHFNTGDIELHKASQRHWVKDVGPIVETNIGFIETYMDPTGVRAEFEGFVAVVDKKQSEQTAAVVNNATLFLSKSPWPREFEKDTFLKPDFTSLSVVAFGCSGTPLGINIPNYDDIRQEEGFKNVYLGNCVPKLTKVNYMDRHLGDNLIKFFNPVLFHKVVFHELLGHGCGKLFTEDSQGNLNFNPCTVNPITQRPIESWYKSNETWASVFGKLNNPYEECRADSVALYFSCFPEATEVLQPEFKNDWKSIMEGVFTEFVLAGVGSLEFYNPETNKFLQAHVNGRFVILRVLLEAGNGFITIEKTKNGEGKDWISINIDQEQILTTGFNAMKNFLLKLNVFKATADFARASKMFGDYSTPDEFLLSLRPIILENKKPRRIEIQGNLDIIGNDIVYKTYPENFEGVIQSFKERFNLIDHEMLSIWEETKEYIKPLQVDKN